jgi:glycosyltransferase involved in cell wall biosynthesis
MGAPPGSVEPAEANRPRLALIGPLPPFRSGIAQHTMMLAGVLDPRCDLLVVSFERQYPRWLFPGESDVDPAAQKVDARNIHYLLDSLRPSTWKRTAELVAAHRPRAAILPWWTVYWTPCFLALARRLGRAGIPIHFFCHNVVDHEASWWKKALTRRVLTRGAGFFTQSNAESARLRALVPHARATVYPHPVSTQFPAPTAPLPRRARLELLFFGIVRPYKGLDVLLRALANLPDLDFKLTVAGEFWERAETTTRLIVELGLGDRVDLTGRFVPATEAANLFARADVVILPYRRATSSGVLGLAYRYGKPVIASRVPGLLEVVREGETGWLVEPDSPGDLARVLSGLTAERTRALAPAIAAFATTLTWESLADAVLEQLLATNS